MNGSMYELIAIAMRYFFAALMVFIAVRAWKITITDSRRAARLRRLSPQTGLCGEFVVITGDGRARDGMRYPVIREGLIGASGKADVRLRSRSVRRIHAFFELTPRGLRLRSNSHAPLYFAGKSRREVFLQDGGHITVGRVELLLVLNVPVEAPANDEVDVFETDVIREADSLFETDPVEKTVTADEKFSHSDENAHVHIRSADMDDMIAEIRRARVSAMKNEDEYSEAFRRPSSGDAAPLPRWPESSRAYSGPFHTPAAMEDAPEEAPAGNSPSPASVPEDDPLAPERNDEFEEWLSSDDDDCEDEPALKWESQWEDFPRPHKRQKVSAASDEDDFFNI